MGSLLAETLPLALGAAVSPVLLLLTLATLSGPRRLSRGTALALGAAVPLVALTLLALLIGIRTGHMPKHDEGALDLAIGLVLLALGFRALRHPPRPGAEPRTPQSDHPAGLARSFVLGMAAMSTNVTTIALYIPAMKMVAASDTDDAAKVAVAVIAMAVTLSVVLVPLLLTAIAPGASGRLLDALGRFMTARRHVIEVVLMLGFGGYLMFRALTELM
jgi:hypothetical protein